MADTPGFGIGGWIVLSNFTILVIGGIVGSIIAYKFFKNGDVNLKSEAALTSQDYMEDEIYKTMYATASYPATVSENKDRIYDAISRFRVDMRNLVQRLRRKEISPTQFRGSLRDLGQELNSQLHIGQIGQISRAERKVDCEARITGAVNRVQASRASQATKDRLVAHLTALKQRC